MLLMVKLEHRDQRKIIAIKDCERSCISSSNDSNDAGPSCKKRHPVFNKDLTAPLRRMQDSKLFEQQLDMPEIRNNLVSCRVPLNAIDVL
jgi:hypothetical protein